MRGKMKTLVGTLFLSGNPFEHYTAESEPDIASYAIRPPYLQAVSDRARGFSSFILFGDRGAGKSATRITVFNEIWKSNSDDDESNERKPFVVNLTDYSSIQDVFRKGRLQERNIVAIVAFVVVEQILAWLSSLEEGDRQIYIEGLDKGERTIMFALLSGFYLSVPEMDRNVSTSEALRLLNSAWTTKSAVWAAKRWDSLSAIIAAAINVFSKKQIDESIDISVPAEALLKSLKGDAANAPRAVLGKLVELVQAFGFAGVCVLVDKVDETPATSKSGEATARLIHPLLAHVQLLEVPSFSWILFLWSNVKNHFSAKYPVRLDKIANASITWNVDSLKEMIDARLKYFSSGRLVFSGLFSEGLDSGKIFGDLAKMSIKSPRELIKLMDIIFREHDVRSDEALELLDQHSLEIGQNKYAVENIGMWFDTNPLQQVLRLGKVSFVNKDVQSAFKISDQGACVKINTWQDAGLVRQSGTAPSEAGGKPVYRFVVADARVERIILEKLDPIVGAELEDIETEGDEDIETEGDEA